MIKIHMINLSKLTLKTYDKTLIIGGIHMSGWIIFD